MYYNFVSIKFLVSIVEQTCIFAIINGKYLKFQYFPACGYFLPFQRKYNKETHISITQTDNYDKGLELNNVIFSS